MRRVLTGALLLCALMVIATPVLADEVGDLKRMVQELKKEVADLRADRALEASSVERAVDDYLTRRAAGEGAGEMAGYMDGHFGIGSGDGAFDLKIGGGIVFDLRLFECDGLQDNTFDIELVRLNFSGHVFDDWYYKIQPEFYTSGVTLKDAYIQTSLGTIAGGTGNEYFDGLQLRFGQFKMPFSYGELVSSYKTDMINRPLIVSYLAPGRDIGFQVSNTVMDGALDYALAISNGTNSTNSSDEFWYWARADAAPFHGDDGEMFQNLHFGVSFGTSWGNPGWTPSLPSYGGGPYGVPGEMADFATYSGGTYPTIDVAGRQLLAGFELRWWWQQWSFRGEFIHAKQEVNEAPSGYTFPITDFGLPYGPSDNVETNGCYAQVAYMITGQDWSEAPSEGLEGVFRFDYVNVDWGGDADDGDIMAFSLGLNYYFNKNVRAMFNYVATDFGDDSLRPIEKDGYIRGGGVDHNLFLRLQLTF